MKREHKSVSERLDLPAEALSAVPLTELHGRTMVRVENHCGIVEYTPELVCVAVRRGSIRVRGSVLVIARMTRRCVEVRGTIFAVELE